MHCSSHCFPCDCCFSCCCWSCCCWRRPLLLLLLLLRRLLRLLQTLLLHCRQDRGRRRRWQWMRATGYLLGLQPRHCSCCWCPSCGRRSCLLLRCMHLLRRLRLPRHCRSKLCVADVLQRSRLSSNPIPNHYHRLPSCLDVSGRHALHNLHGRALNSLHGPALSNLHPRLARSRAGGQPCPWLLKRARLWRLKRPPRARVVLQLLLLQVLLPLLLLLLPLLLPLLLLPQE